MIEMNEKEVYTTSPNEKRVHRIDTDVYFSRCTRLNGDTLVMFEEVNIEDVLQLEIPDDFEEIDTPIEWTDYQKDPVGGGTP